MITAEDLIKRFNMKPLPEEGGMFVPFFGKYLSDDDFHIVMRFP